MCTFTFQIEQEITEEEQLPDFRLLWSVEKSIESSAGNNLTEI